MCTVRKEGNGRRRKGGVGQRSEENVKKGRVGKRRGRARKRGNHRRKDKCRITQKK